MKELNRRAFLTLSGAAVAMMALAACSEPSAPPAAPANGEAAKVLEAINLYRKNAGVDEPLTMDDGLKSAAELTMKIAKGEIKYDAAAGLALAAAFDDYNKIGAPIGFYDDGTRVVPVCVYSEDVELMALTLPLQVDEVDKNNLKSPVFNLVNIQTFELSGVTYWVAVIADRKK